MKKFLKLFVLSLVLVSCTTAMIPKEKAYELNKKYMKEIYNLDVDDKEVGIYVGKKHYDMYSLVGNTIYKLTFDKEGKIIKKESYNTIGE